MSMSIEDIAPENLKVVYDDRLQDVFDYLDSNDKEDLILMVMEYIAASDEAVDELIKEMDESTAKMDKFIEDIEARKNKE